jgi:hypothetical protein
MTMPRHYQAGSGKCIQCGGPIGLPRPGEHVEDDALCRVCRGVQEACWQTQYGFEWGPMTVTRIASDPRVGYVLEIGAEGTDETVMVRVTWKGRKIHVIERDGGDKP